MAEINENNEENVLKEKSRVKSEIVEINEKKDKNVIGENRRAKSFDYYPSQPDRNISLPEENEIDFVKHDHELVENYYGFDPSQRFKLFQIEAAERRKKKIASRTNSANSSNSNTKPSTSANTESDKAINSKSNEIENVDEIVEISPRNYDKPLSNLSKLSLEIEEISEEIPEDAEALKNKKEIKEGKKMRALSDSGMF
uniref:Uncharacterized protein n=1 Tax=Meloidogyne hapla TaxID=6305 RepID=A0A1I8BZL3_MELHA